MNISIELLTDVNIGLKTTLTVWLITEDEQDCLWWNLFIKKVKNIEAP